jgi:hypothetical protein
MDFHEVVLEEIPSPLDQTCVKPQGEDGDPLSFLPGDAPRHDRAEVAQKLLDGVSGTDKPVPIRVMKGLLVLVGRGMIEDQEDREIPEEHPGFSAQQAAEAVAIHGVALGVHQQHLGFAPGILGQSHQRVRGMEDAMASAFKRHSQALDEAVMTGNNQQVHGEPNTGAPW